MGSPKFARWRFELAMIRLLLRDPDKTWVQMVLPEGGGEALLLLCMLSLMK